MHLRAPEHVKMSLKNLSLATDIFGKPHDVAQKCTKIENKLSSGGL